MYCVFGCSFKCWLQRSSVFQDQGLRNLIGMPYNKMKWFIGQDLEIACNLITFIYISRCQLDRNHCYTCTILALFFCYKPFRCDEEFEAFDSKTDWLKNLTKMYKLIPRELLFERKQHSISGHQNDSDPTLELIHPKQCGPKSRRAQSRLDESRLT